MTMGLSYAAGVGLFLFGIIVGVVLVEQRDDTPEPQSPEHARHLFVTDQIDHQEFEQRLDELMDEQANQIRTAVQRIGGVGPKTALDIAAEFDSLEDVRQADRDDLEDVHGVGPSLAEEIDERFGG